jgi:hypothetical protein
MELAKSSKILKKQACVTNSIPSAKFSFKKDQSRMFSKLEEKLYQCNFNNNCKKMFGTEQKIKKHVRSHIFKKQIICSFHECNKKFSSMNNLKVFYLSK